jgi:hypothetical protein
VPSDAADECVPAEQCAAGTYALRGECADCELHVAAPLAAGSLLLFCLLVYHLLSSLKPMRLVLWRTLLSFFQAAHLATLIDVPLPVLARWLPFNVPWASVECVLRQLPFLGDAGWDAQWTYLATVYLFFMFGIWEWLSWRKVTGVSDAENIPFNNR